MEHTDHVARLLKEVAGARTAIVAAYLRLWRSEAPGPTDPDAHERTGRTGYEPRIDRQREERGSLDQGG